MPWAAANTEISEKKLAKKRNLALGYIVGLFAAKVYLRGYPHVTAMLSNHDFNVTIILSGKGARS
jgi:hypothetical protein